ncbi:hypothetical protein L6452_09461 [Arctium lappa]|uniref:Uncharacterized protein n=1 Tax=Arctium lappa TaxID=4217 RepID=A0ACB9DK51_ARCLA|nr:hypothetical protein L6452_09461 [Arctium lappa]
MVEIGLQEEEEIWGFFRTTFKGIARGRRRIIGYGFFFRTELKGDLDEIDYYCPECKGESVEQPVVDNSEPKLRSTESSQRSVLPDKISVICTGIEGIYYPKLHLQNL